MFPWKRPSGYPKKGRWPPKPPNPPDPPPPPPPPRRTTARPRVAMKRNGNGTEARGIFRKAKASFTGEADVKKYRAGLELLKRAAALDHVGAHEWLGAVYDYGLGTRPNRRLAFQHYLTAAKAGNPNSEYHVGIFYFYFGGIGVGKNHRLAVKWLRRAVDHGDAHAMHVLGKCYRYGQGTRKSSEKGFGLQLRAAQKGVVEAQFSVGVCLSKGEGVRPDPEQAFRWYLRAAKKGHDDAAYNLGYFYDTGKGARKNSRKAAYWYARADELRRRPTSMTHPLQL
jgi:TPR repeat protein